MNAFPLESHTVVQTGSARSISEAASGRVAGHRLKLYGEANAEGGYLHHASLGHVSLSNVCFGSEVLVEGDAARDYYAQLVLAGKLDVRVSGRSFMVDDQGIALINPTHSARLHHTADCNVLIVRVQRSAIERRLVNWLGKAMIQPLEFAPLASKNQAQMGSLLRTIEHICQELNDSSSVMRVPYMARHLELLLTDTLLLAAPHSFSDRLEREIDVSGPDSLQRAERYMDEHLDGEIVLADLVQASCISERSLYNVFRQYRNSTPMARLKAKRLLLARRMLEDSGHRIHRTVAEVAMAVGMPHLGNFAGDFKRMFGELPSATTRRSGTLNRE